MTGTSIFPEVTGTFYFHVYALFNHKFGIIFTVRITRTSNFDHEFTFSRLIK
jgi:hypothetical protein